MLTKTQMKEVAKICRTRQENHRRVHISHLHRLSRRFDGVALKTVVVWATDLGYTVYGEHEEPSQPQKAVVPGTVEPPLSDIVKRQIITGGIYRQLTSVEEGEDDSHIPVVTTLGQWRRERDAILKWLADSGAKFPD